jgi:uncharacterized protein (DUF927 family)
MKIEIKKSEIRNSGALVIKIGYTEMSNIFKESIFCVTSQYGWDYDVWFFPEENVIITKGYRPIGMSVPEEIKKSFTKGGDVKSFVKAIKKYYE